MSTPEALLWQQLRGAQLVSEEDPPQARAAPWYINLMFGVSAWFAALFTMGFFAFALSDLWRDAAALFMTGLMCCAGALALLLLARGEFVAQLGVPFSLAGQGLIAAAAATGVTDSGRVSAFGLTLVLVGGAMSLAAPQKMHRFLSTLVCLTGVYVMTFQADAEWLAAPLYGVGVVALWWLVRDASARGQFLSLRPQAFALAFALLAVLWISHLPDLFRNSPGPDDLGLLGVRPGHVMMFALWLVTAAIALHPQRGALGPMRSTLVFALAAIVGVLLLPAPGVNAALIVLVTGFMAAERTLIAMAILGLLSYLSRYYYQLDLDLLAKSGVLAAGGIALLALHFVPGGTGRYGAATRNPA